MAAEKIKPNGFFEAGHDHDICVADSIAAAERICAARGARLTADRRQVLEILLNEHSGIGAYDIIERMDWRGRKRASSVVYRALDFLAALGLVHKLHSQSAYIACAQPGDAHGAQFLICTECDGVAEIAAADVGKAVTGAARRAGFAVAHPVIEIQGLCPSCAEHGAAAHG